jgi:cobalt/nickel transport system permease protein
MIPSFLLQHNTPPLSDIPKQKELSFIDKTIRNIASFIAVTFSQWHTARKTGLFQSVDSRVKVFFLFASILLINLNPVLFHQAVYALLLFLFCLLSRLDIVNVYKKILSIGFVFGFLVFMPALFNIFTPGDPVFTVIQFSREHHWLIYSIPREITVTSEGIHNVSRLTLKVINSVSVVFLIASTTSFERIIKSLSFFNVPNIFLLTLTLSYKFIFILSHVILESYRAIKMRWWNPKTGVEINEIVAGRIGFLFRKSWERYEIVYQSMTARGFTGRVNFCYIGKMSTTDYIFLFTFLISVIFNCFQLKHYAGTL